MKNNFNDDIDKIVKEVREQAESDFEEIWLKLLTNPRITERFELNQMDTIKKIMQHGFVFGAEQAILIIMEKVAQQLCE